MEMIYHIMIDRFYPTNETFKERCFNGGTIRGIIEKLDYIQNLGMNGIMLSPFYLTEEYHGYHIKDYTKVDPHFGNWDDVKRLVNEVHARKMFIVADFVPNHCHESNALFSDGKHDDWFLFNKNGTRKCFAGITTLPMFNSDNIDVQKFFVEQAIKLCQLGFDAIRLDHASGPSYAFWKFFCTHLKEKYPKVQLIGEVLGDLDFKPRRKFRYLWNKLLYTSQEARQLEYVGVLDGVFDFRYQEIVANYIRRRDDMHISDLERQVRKHFERYPSNFKLWLFLDNHDLNRFMYNCNDDFELLQKAITYTKRWAKTFLIYYGTEFGMTNKENIHCVPYGDEQVRKCIKWDCLHTPMIKSF